MINNYYAVIMAGGGGTRLWPLSRQARPKQMLRLGGDRTLFQMAIDRLNDIFPPERILIVTVAEQAVQLQAQCPQIPQENFLLEPLPRGTASVVGLAAAAIQQRDPDATMAVLTADHFIENVSYFRKLILAAYDLAQDNYLVTLGIKPTFAATGYGYVQRGETVGKFGDFQAYRVLKFKEKPDEVTAKLFLQKGDHDWNSGMFVWRIDRIMQEFQRWMPELAADLIKIAAAWAGDERGGVIQSLWPTIKPQTIDYGIMERADRVAVLPALKLGWNDVGSWDSLFDVLKTDENGNINLGANYLGLDTKSTLVCADQSDRLIVTIGVRDLIVVDTGDAILICPRDEAQKVRQLVNYLKENGPSDYL
ncbi:MAG: mannose-1-phosphate guanylyltransferase [Anaerolineaceae bacterium]|nr:mannose-1-phosphate guanylyltransferase [Anaerolineaceae bacterium]